MAHRADCRLARSIRDGLDAGRSDRASVLRGSQRRVRPDRQRGCDHQLQTNSQECSRDTPELRATPRPSPRTSASASSSATSRALTSTTTPLPTSTRSIRAGRRFGERPHPRSSLPVPPAPFQWWCADRRPTYIHCGRQATSHPDDRDCRRTDIPIGQRRSAPGVRKPLPSARLILAS